VLSALREGADGVLIGGCHPGDCHYQEGNYKALRRFTLLKTFLRAMGVEDERVRLGVEDERVRLEWIAASEGDKVRNVINDMTEKIRELGPLHLEPRVLIHPESLSPEPSESSAMAQGEAS